MLDLEGAVSAFVSNLKAAAMPDFVAKVLESQSVALNNLFVLGRIGKCKWQNSKIRQILPMNARE